MSITVEKAWEILKSRGIETEEELQRELKRKEIEIGMFTMEISKGVNNEA